MKLTKKLVSFGLAAVMTLSLIVPAMAAMPNMDFQKLNDSGYSFTEVEQERFMKAFMQLSDEEYDVVIARLVAESNDLIMLEERLELCGINVGCLKEITPTDEAAVCGTTRATHVTLSDITIIATATQRTQQTNWRVGGSVIFSKAEQCPDSIDAAVVYFDSTKLQYRSYDTGSTGAITLQSGAQANNGTLIFNYDDSKMVNNTVYTAMAVVVPTAATGTTVNFGIDFIHTYSNTSIVPTGATLTGTFGGSGPVSGSIGVSFAPKTDRFDVKIADTGNFKI